MLELVYKQLEIDTGHATGQGIPDHRGRDGRRGAPLAHERQPALILMDIQLRGISGVEALQRLRVDPVTHHTPVIAVTASVMPQDRTRIMAAGFNGFQGKADQRPGTSGHGARDSRQAISGADRSVMVITRRRVISGLALVTVGAPWRRMPRRLTGPPRSDSIQVTVHGTSRSKRECAILAGWRAKAS